MADESPPTARLYFAQDMADAEVHALAGGLAAVYSARCPGKDSPNEDAAGLIPFDDRSGILVIADGVGGVRAGDRAALLAAEALTTSLRTAARDGTMLRTAVLNGFDEANQAVQSLGVGAATTLAVVEIQDNVVRPYHVGDSMILVTGQRGKIKLQTVSHSPVGFAVESGYLDAAEAMHHEDRHLVSNLVGTPDMRIEVGSAVTLAARDTLLLATDGLLDNLHVGEVVELIRKGPLHAAARHVAAAAHRRMTQSDEGHPSKPDDMTFTAFRLRS